ncbi:sensor histidine kinase [Myroides odoratimimus]|uniref:sensor histidine kinase n=1 Tax=Myroides odoratimimus TaxID=76832 RepID=UPI00257894C5|nr:histidine kinase [Myroides odoratimimus]
MKKVEMNINWRRHIVLACSISVLISLVISYFTFRNSELSLGELLINYRFLKNTFLSFVLSMLIYAANVLTSAWVCRVMDKRDAKNEIAMSKITRNAVFFVNGIMTSIVSYYLFLALLLNLFYSLSFKAFFLGQHLSFGNFLGALLLSTFILLIVFTFAYHDELRLLELKNREMEIELQKSQIEGMKEQLSPHFLFNNMNVLISTIQEDPVKAEQFARSFSKIYRYVLEKLDYPLCNLSDEVSFIRDYVYLLNVRYDNAIAFSISEEVMKYDDVEVPTLSLQLLIENIVKHNVIPSEGSIRVELRIEEGGLVLWNEKYAKPKEVYSSGLGLQNLSKRNKLMLKQDIEISDLEDSFSVRIPLVRIES